MLNIVIRNRSVGLKKKVMNSLEAFEMWAYQEVLRIMGKEK